MCRPRPQWTRQEAAEEVYNNLADPLEPARRDGHGDVTKICGDGSAFFHWGRIRWFGAGRSQQAGFGRGMSLNDLFHFGQDGYGPLMIVVSFLDLKSMTMLASTTRCYAQSLHNFFHLDPEAAKTYRPKGFDLEEIKDLIHPKCGARERVFENVVFSPHVLDHTVSVEIDFNSNSMLEYSCYKGYSKSARFLLTKPFNVRYLNFAFEYAAFNGNLEIVKLLIQRPLSTTYINKSLTRALVKKHWEVAAEILKDFRTCLNYKSSSHIKQIYAGNQKAMDQAISLKRKAKTGSATEAKDHIYADLMERVRKEQLAAEKAEKKKKRGTLKSRLSKTFSNLFKFKKKMTRKEKRMSVHVAPSGSGSGKKGRLNRKSSKLKLKGRPPKPKAKGKQKRGRKVVVEETPGGEEGEYEEEGEGEFEAPPMSPSVLRKKREDEIEEKKRLAEQEAVEAKAAEMKAEAVRLVRRAQLADHLRRLNQLAAADGQEVVLRKVGNDVPAKPESPTVLGDLKAPDPAEQARLREIVSGDGSKLRKAARKQLKIERKAAKRAQRESRKSLRIERKAVLAAAAAAAAAATAPAPAPAPEAELPVEVTRSEPDEVDRGSEEVEEVVEVRRRVPRKKREGPDPLNGELDRQIIKMSSMRKAFLGSLRSLETKIAGIVKTHEDTYKAPLVDKFASYGKEEIEEPSSTPGRSSRVAFMKRQNEKLMDENKRLKSTIMDKDDLIAKLQKQLQQFKADAEES